MGKNLIGKMMRRAGAGLLALTLVSTAAAEERPALVAVDPVTVEVLSQTIPVIGRFVARQRGSVAASTAGLVRSVFVEVGDRVAEGDPLVALDEEKLRETRNLQAAALDEARAAVNTAKESLALARLELKRLERLKESAAFSQARLDDKRQEVARYNSEVMEAEAAVARARANLQLAKIDLARATIKAPFDGVVVDRKVDLGTYVNVGQEIAVLINDRDMEIEADVPANRISGLKTGRLVQAQLAGGRTIATAVRAVIPEENALTRTRAVRFTPALDKSKTLSLAAGQSATVLVPIGEAREILSVHKDSVLPKGDGHLVFIVEDGQALMRKVTLGEAVGNRFEVLGGVKEGELVITRGNERIAPGQTVTYPKPDKSENEAGGATSDVRQADG